MGQIKNLYMKMIKANDGKIPKEATIADLQKMKDLKTFEWEEYEQKKIKLWLNQSKNSEEKSKIEKTNKKFSWYYAGSTDKKSK